MARAKKKNHTRSGEAEPGAFKGTGSWSYGGILIEKPMTLHRAGEDRWINLAILGSLTCDIDGQT